MTSTRHRAIVAGVIRSLSVFLSITNSKFAAVDLIFSPVMNPNGTVKADSITAMGAKKIERGTNVPVNTQAGIPDANFTSGNRLTAIRADPPPSSARADFFFQRLLVKSATRIRNAKPSINMAKMGLAIAPCLIGKDKSTESNNLKKHAIKMTRMGTKNRLVATQLTEIKNNATPVITEPDIMAAQL